MGVLFFVNFFFFFLVNSRTINWSLDVRQMVFILVNINVLMFIYIYIYIYIDGWMDGWMVGFWISVVCPLRWFLF